MDGKLLKEIEEKASLERKDFVLLTGV